jgi:L-aminopeptidase/D-esterase-like protein
MAARTNYQLLSQEAQRLGQRASTGYAPARGPASSRNGRDGL